MRTPLWREMRVAHIREREGAEAAEVVFLESARFYTLPRTSPAFDRILGQLHDAMARGHAVDIRLASMDSDVIEDVRAS